MVVNISFWYQKKPFETVTTPWLKGVREFLAVLQ
jgi:hypothetical protein